MPPPVYNLAEMWGCKYKNYNAINAKNKINYNAYNAKYKLNYNAINAKNKKTKMPVMKKIK